MTGLNCCTLRRARKTAPERYNSTADAGDASEDDNEFTGPLHHRSCTDIICLLLFIAFVIVMIVALGYGSYYGDPARVTRGYDVAGNVCGGKNDVIEGVALSGQDMTSQMFLMFDLVKTAQIMGEQALKDTRSILGLPTLADRSNLTSNETLVFCMGYQNPKLLFAPSAFSASITTSSPAVANVVNRDAPVSSLAFQRLLSRLDAVELARGPDDLSAVLTGTGEIRVFRTAALTTDDARNASATARAAQSVVGVTTSELQQLASYDPITAALNGGGSCRYCVVHCSNTTVAFFSRCLPIPSTIENTLSAFYSASGLGDFLSDAVADIKLSWPQIVYMTLVAIGLTLIVIVVLRFLAGFIVYVVLGLLCLTAIAGTVFLWVIWAIKRNYYDSYVHQNSSATLDPGENVPLNSLAVESRLEKAYSQQEVNGFLAAAIIATIVTVLVLLIVFILRKRIGLLVQLFKEAGTAIQAMPIILIQPLWTLLALAIACTCWICGEIVIESAGTPVQSNSTGFVTFEKDWFLITMRWLYIFGILWITQFIIACQHMVVAGAIATWYFTKYHLGSVALGSALIAILKFIRLILSLVQSRLKHYEHGSAGRCVRACLTCCQCCLLCFEKIIKFIDSNAYIEIAIYGCNFCTAARKVFALVTSNILRVATINSVGSFILLMGKVVVVVATILIGILIMQAKDPDSDGRVVTYQWVPILLSAVLALIIADCFIDIYGMALDTIFVCFCEDCERNDGVTKPYFMTRGLMHFVNNAKKAMDADDKRKRSKVEDKNK